VLVARKICIIEVERALVSRVCVWFEHIVSAYIEVESRSCRMIVCGLNTSYLFRLKSTVARVAWLYVCLNTSYLYIEVGSRSCRMIVCLFEHIASVFIEVGSRSCHMVVHGLNTSNL
jgi:hypothetical protein